MLSDDVAAAHMRWLVGQYAEAVGRDDVQRVGEVLEAIDIHGELTGQVVPRFDSVATGRGLH